MASGLDLNARVLHLPLGHETICKVQHSCPEPKIDAALDTLFPHPYPRMEKFSDAESALRWFTYSELGLLITDHKGLAMCCVPDVQIIQNYCE